MFLKLSCRILHETKTKNPVLNLSTTVHSRTRYSTSTLCASLFINFSPVQTLILQFLTSIGIVGGSKLGGLSSSTDVSPIIKELRDANIVLSSRAISTDADPAILDIYWHVFHRIPLPLIVWLQSKLERILVQ